jgi:hypothetical protein
LALAYVSDVTCRVALANEAAHRGVRIVQIDRTSRHIAVEPNSPTAYAVDVKHCACKRFRLWDAATTTRSSRAS